MTTLLANPKLPNTGKWQDRHNDAINHRHAFSPFQQPIVDMLKAWAGYAEDHQGQYESKIGDDGVLGKEWEQIGDALRGLLNGATGNLDCGTVDGFILETMRENGIDTSQK